MAADDRETLRATFDEAAELYDTARPGYPEALIDDLVSLAGLGGDAVVLEIGCGTGQATRALARRGFAIVCVELGGALAEVARRALAEHRRVRVVTAAFETWDAQGAAFDLVLAATAWHWLDPAVRYTRAAEVLRPWGALAIVTTHHVLPSDGDRFFIDIQDVYEMIGEGDGSAGPPDPAEVPDERQEIAATGLFGGVEVRRHVWSRSYTADEYLALLDTYSGHRAMEPGGRERLYTEIRRRIDARPDRRVRKHYLNVLHVAHRSVAGASNGARDGATDHS